jgi:dTDP-4-amino-4,6-dideoxygalactose transaminase
MIPMLDLKQEFLQLQKEMKTAVMDVLKSAKYILGPRCTELEEKIANYHGVNHAVALASGTDALILSLKALGIGVGDEVITTPFTFFATVESIIICGAVPIFVDIDEDTMNITPEGILNKITKKTKAIIPVHIFGTPCDMPKIMEIAKKYNLHIIEDCAQSFGATINNKKTGTFGDTGCFSFYPSKNLGCYGDGGMVITNNPEVKDTLISLRNHGASATYVHDKIGINSRLDEIQAAILLIKFKQIDIMNNHRRDNALYYNSLLGSVVKCPIIPDKTECVFHQYTIRSKNRDKLKETLEKKQISSVIYYPVPMHLQPALSGYGYKKGDLPISERTALSVLSLPIYPGLIKEDIKRVADVIISFEKSC